ncbi:MAG TPA: outer membrane lipoprotein-sorting protein [Candidatus Coatesbacteria bacterium]|nr:outer membrane lipoprotein-sorting protein [Candidatus Coatesbacteria bacterium]
MRRFILFILLSALPATALTAEEIIQAVDSNMVYDTLTAVAKMEIVTPEGDTRTKLMTIIARGSDDALIEVTYPGREAGTRQLRLGDELWLYIPSEDKELKLTGNMLRRSMLGSDFSYEDMMSRHQLLEDYEAELEKNEDYRGRDCYVILLSARRLDVTYRTRRVWIDVELLVPLKQQLFAASGALLKESTMGGIARYGDRYYPTIMVMRDLVRGAGKTTVTMSDLKFDVAIPEEVFSKARLRG